MMEVLRIGGSAKGGERRGWKKFFSTFSGMRIAKVLIWIKDMWHIDICINEMSLINHSCCTERHFEICSSAKQDVLVFRKGRSKKTRSFYLHFELVVILQWYIYIIYMSQFFKVPTEVKATPALLLSWREYCTFYANRSKFFSSTFQG